MCSKLQWRSPRGSSVAVRLGGRSLCASAMKATIAGRREQRALHGSVSPADLARLVVVVVSCDALAACQPHRESETFPIIVISMLCEESRRIRVSRIRCYFAPARSPEWREERVTSGASWFL